METKKTYGQRADEHWSKTHELEDDVREYTRAIGKDVMDRMHQVVGEAKDVEIYKNKDFYIVLLLRIQKLGQAFDPLVFARRSCPTPVYSQSVYKYHHLSGALEFLWNIPDRFRYYDIINRPQHYLQLGKDASETAKTVLLMESGELLKWVKKENGEKPDAIIFTNRPIGEIEC